MFLVFYETTEICYWLFVWFVFWCLDIWLRKFLLTPSWFTGIFLFVKVFFTEEKKKGGQDAFYILTLFLGLTTILWMRKSFLNLNEMVASPTQGVKMCESSPVVDKFKVGCFSWYLSQLVSLLVADTTHMQSSGDLANRHATLLAARWKKVLLVWRVLSLLVHVKRSTEVCHLWAHHYFSSSALHIWFF